MQLTCNILQTELLSRTVLGVIVEVVHWPSLSRYLSRLISPVNLCIRSYRLPLLIKFFIIFEADFTDLVWNDFFFEVFSPISSCTIFQIVYTDLIFGDIFNVNSTGQFSKCIRSWFHWLHLGRYFLSLYSPVTFFEHI